MKIITDKNRYLSFLRKAACKRGCTTGEDGIIKKRYEDIKSTHEKTLLPVKMAAVPFLLKRALRSKEV